ncbi:MAG: hypothetical protein AAGK22_23825 [Acidobacteriota bacterium]
MSLSGASVEGRRSLLTVCILEVVLLAAALPAQKVESVTDPTAVRRTFEAYKDALVSGNAAQAVAQVDDGTLEYFGALRDLAISAGEEAIRERSFVDQLLILSMRHSFEPGTLQSLTLEQLMTRATSEGWIAPQTVAQLEMGAVQIEGDRAYGEAMTRATAANPELSSPIDGLRYEFVRASDGTWRFGFGSLVQSLNVLVEQLTGQLGGNQDDFLFMLIESFSGEKVLPEVWNVPPSRLPEEKMEPRR